MPEKPSIQKFFHELDKDTMHLVEEFYDKDIQFTDPLIQVQSVEKMRGYYQSLYDNVKSIKFEFSDEVIMGNTHVAVWKMILVSKLKGGKPVEVDGISHIKFGGAENKAVYHRDYYDMGQFVYEDIPLLGGVIHFIKRKLTEHA